MTTERDIINQVILVKSLIRQLLEKKEVIEKVTSEKLQVLKDFLEDKAPIGDTIRIMQEIEKEFPAD